MEKQIELQYHPEWLIRRTGDPFADVGGIVIKLLQQQFPEESILAMIERVARIYINQWGGKINAYFLNSKITNNAYKGEAKNIQTKEYFLGLLRESAAYEIGYCRILGEKTKLFSAGRDNSILSGSGTFINFHHAYNPGLALSKEVIIRMFFVPMGTESLGGRIALIDSNLEEIVESKVAEVLKANLDHVASGIGKGVFTSQFNNPANSLFEFAANMIRKIDGKKIDNATINLYHFTNFGASPETNLYSFPTTIFRFYKEVLKYPKFQESWNHFIRSHYRSSKFKNSRYDATSGKMMYSEKKQEKRMTFEGKHGFQTWYNPIYDFLLQGKPIRGFFLRWLKKEHTFIHLNIVKLYQIHIRNMKKETLDKIDELAEFIIRDENQLKKRLTKLDSFTSSHQLRRWFITDMLRENYFQKNSNPLFSVDDYVQYLFPDGQFWQEVRDVLLISVYQKMHEKQIWIDSLTSTD